MDIIELLRKNQDVDEYSSKPVSDEDMKELLEAVRYTASAANTQPWEIYVVKDEQAKRLLGSCVLDPMLRAKEEDPRVEKAAVAVVFAINRKRARARYGEQGETYYSVQDIGAAVNNMRLSAALKGISSGWIREVDLDAVSKVLKLSKLIKPMALLIMGYSEQNTEEPPLLDSSAWVNIIDGR